MNVLYGKNGRGKTTLLHILANFLELDFERFRFLQFREINIATFGGTVVSIERDPSSSEGWIRLRVNGNRFGGDGPLPILDSTDRQALRKLIGGRPVYLPAFRAILERVRSAAYEASSTRDPELERIREEERQAQREIDGGSRRLRSLYSSAGRDQSALTARKTVQCREWFGPFVPVVRYPSILEVTDRLASEFRDAQIETGMQERQMLSEMFVEVFKALVSEEDVPSESEIDTLMHRVRNAVEEEGGSNEHEFYTDRIGSKLAPVIGVVRQRGTQQGGAAELRVLRLYAQMLERRNQERSGSFSKVKHFEAAVNKFFDAKTLHISDERPSPSGRPDGGVYVKTEDDRRYSLSSLSSGERQVLTMLFSATRMSSATGVFLVDEPELSLHIDWQRIILGELIAQAGGRQIIACTHSPEVGAEHMQSLQFFDPELAVHALPERPSDESDSVLDESI